MRVETAARNCRSGRLAASDARERGPRPEGNEEFAYPVRGGTSFCSHVEGEDLLKERFLGLLLNMVITLLGVGEPVDPNHASMRKAVSA